jgi:predicted GNAT family acetyltransferase
MSEQAVRDNAEAQRFEIWVAGELAGFARYQRMGDDLAITHTEIDDRFEGQGLGSALARSVLDSLREAGTKVLPYCPFVRGYIDRHPEYLDLVPADLRDRFQLPA